MRRFLFFFGIALLIYLGLSYKNNWFPFGWPDTKILSTSQWESVLIGKWEFNGKEKSDRGYWEAQKGQVEFSSTRKFELGITWQYYTPLANGGVDMQVTSGGFLKSKWKITGGYIELFDQFECNIDRTYCRYPYESIQFPNCEYYQNIKYGNLNGDLKTEVIIFSKHKILIKGRRFSDGAYIEYEFLKLK